MSIYNNSIEKQIEMRLWWIPQVPGKEFYVSVDTVEEAIFIYNILEKYDIFQYKNNIKPDYANAGGLEIYEDGEWVTWYDHHGSTFEDYLKHNKGE